MLPLQPPILTSPRPISTKEITSHDGQVDKNLARDALIQPVLPKVDLKRDELTPDDSQLQLPDPTSVSDSQDDIVELGIG